MKFINTSAVDISGAPCFEAVTIRSYVLPSSYSPGPKLDEMEPVALLMEKRFSVLELLDME